MIKEQFKLKINDTVNPLEFIVMKKLSSIFIVCVYGLIAQANTLLQNIQTGKPFTSGTINEMKLVSNGVGFRIKKTYKKTFDK